MKGSNMRLWANSVFLCLFQASRQHGNICFIISSGQTVRISCRHAMCLKDQQGCSGPGRDAADSRSVWLCWTCGCHAPSPCACSSRALSSWPSASPRPACVQKAASAAATPTSTASTSPAVNPVSKKSRPASRWTLSCWDWTTTR